MENDYNNVILVGSFEEKEPKYTPYTSRKPLVFSFRDVEKTKEDDPRFNHSLARGLLEFNLTIKINNDVQAVHILVENLDLIKHLGGNMYKGRRMLVDGTLCDGSVFAKKVLFVDGNNKKCI